jgi:putative aldouronate transport system substrate-binding protein
MQPVPIFSATGGDPLLWGNNQPIFYTFMKKGLGADRIKELLGVLNWCAAPFGTKEWEEREYGKEGTHFTRDSNGAPVGNQLASKEIAFQYGFLVGRTPAIVTKPETPSFVKDLLTYSNEQVKYLEKDPWEGIKLEMPANFSKVLVPTEDKITDVIRGRRPLSDLDGIVSEWRSGGGSEATDFMSKALADNGR